MTTVDDESDLNFALTRQMNEAAIFKQKLDDRIKRNSRRLCQLSYVLSICTSLALLTGMVISLVRTIQNDGIETSDPIRLEFIK